MLTYAPEDPVRSSARKLLEQLRNRNHPKKMKQYKKELRDLSLQSKRAQMTSLDTRFFENYEKAMQEDRQRKIYKKKAIIATGQPMRFRYHLLNEYLHEYKNRLRLKNIKK